MPLIQEFVPVPVPVPHAWKIKDWGYSEMVGSYSAAVKRKKRRNSKNRKYSWRRIYASNEINQTANNDGTVPFGHHSFQTAVAGTLLIAAFVVAVADVALVVVVDDDAVVVVAPVAVPRFYVARRNLS